jgi:aspartyl/asparaginyl beta-hydroxylase (cupin superfamily)
MPIHIDNEEYGEYDFSGKYLNIILPVTSNGWSVVDYKLIKNKRGEAIMFSGQVPHGAMNDTNETRVSIYLIVEKSRFKNDDTE